MMMSMLKSNSLSIRVAPSSDRWLVDRTAMGHPMADRWGEVWIEVASRMLNFQ